MKPLTAVQRRALGLATHKGGVLVGTSSPLPKGTVSGQTATRLVDAGYATLVNGTLLVTKTGRKALSAVLPPAAPVFLRRRDGLTSRMDLRVADEPEVMDPPHPEWRLRAEAHRKLSRQDLDAARLSGLSHPEERLAELRRMAAERGVDVKDELRYVSHSLKLLERKVTREAA